MSADWHVHCLDCNDTQTFDDAHHMQGTMAALCKNAEAIAALVPLIRDGGALGLEVRNHGEVDTQWFAQHLGHRLVPINEYGEALGECSERVDCACGSPMSCKREYGHVGEHDPSLNPRRAPEPATASERLSDPLVAAIADGRASYHIEPRDAIQHATALAAEVRERRARTHRRSLRVATESAVPSSWDTGRAATYLETAALGYATQIKEYAAAVTRDLSAVPAVLLDSIVGAREFLAVTALSYAGARGSLDAAERAELLDQRRFREGVISLRGELVTGNIADGEPIGEVSVHVVETIDALLALFSRDGGEPGSGQPRPRATQQGAATPGQSASSAAGNVAESQLDPTDHRAEPPPSRGTSPQRIALETGTARSHVHIRGVYGDCGENEGVLSVTAVLDANENHPPGALIVVGSPKSSPLIDGYIPDLGCFSCGPDGAEQLIAVLQDAVRDVRQGLLASAFAPKSDHHQ
jgi:hypothetical protein